MLTPFRPSSIEVPAGALPRFLVPELAHKPGCTCNGRCTAELVLGLVELAAKNLPVEQPYMLVLSRDAGAVAAALVRMPAGWQATGAGEVYGRGTHRA